MHYFILLHAPDYLWEILMNVFFRNQRRQLNKKIEGKILKLYEGQLSTSTPQSLA